MIDSDFSAPIDSDDAFSAEEQAAWDAMRSGATDLEPLAGSTVAPAPAAAPEGAPAPAGEAAAPGEVVDPDAEDADDPEKNRGRFVRHGAFHKEREARKTAQRQLSELQEKFARGDERLRILSEAMQRPAAPAQPAAAAEPAKVPDPNEDIFGYAKYLEEQIQAIRTGQTQLTETQKKAEEDRRAADERNDVIGFYRQDLQRAVTADATISDAYQHLFSGRVAELQLVGMSEAEAVQTVREEEFNLAQTARQRGQSPAALIAALAKSRGFAPKAAEAAPAAAPSETAAEKAARVEAGQKGPGMSLSAAGGSPAGEVTAEMLANMSDEEFSAFQKANGRKLRQLMGA
ncbi:hypothetical protein [Methylobacterium sp. C1]|uniref:hypothetical protein n=1 Tax=Methylobacterium sp. C1 TaxID=1479019 RepID=UPI0008D8F154|nr:hypothetical protein [Methylobacterium sp. C1]